MFGPNIQGSSDRLHTITLGGVDRSNGAIASRIQDGSGYNGAATDKSVNIYFNASNSNSIYSGSTVQPKGLFALPCIKF